jgi:hypothetical protein
VDFRRRFFPLGVAHRTGAVSDRARIVLVGSDMERGNG